MVALRLPTAMSFGVLVSVGLFSLLSSLVNGPLDVLTADPIAPPIIRRVFAPTPVEPVRPPPPVPEPPIVRPDPTGPGLRDPENVRPGRGERFTPTTFRTEIPTGASAIGVDRDPLPIVRVDPDYPARALRGEIEGWVEVQFSVSATGAVNDVVIVDSHPGNVFDEAVIKAVGRWRYNPKVHEGIAVERVGVRTIIRFELEQE